MSTATTWTSRARLLTTRSWPTPGCRPTASCDPRSPRRAASPLPKDFTTNFGKYGSEQRLTLDGGEVTTGFLEDSPCRVGADEPCQIARDLAAGFSEDGLPDGWEFTVTWELEIGVGLIDPDDGIKIVDVSPSLSASP